MTITTTTLTRAAGVAPPPPGCSSSASRSATRTWTPHSSPRPSSRPRLLKVVMASWRWSASPGCTCARSAATASSASSATSYSAIGYLVIMSTRSSPPFVLPTIAATEPGVRRRRPHRGHRRTGRAATSARWRSSSRSRASATSSGGLIFGIALFRANVSSPGGRPRCSRSVAPSRPPPTCPTRSTGCSPSPTRSP